MKCPVCFATQKTFPGELIHICPYCDAILIPSEKGYMTIDKFPWWIKKEKELYDATGILITEKHQFFFTYKDKWILDNKYELEKFSDEKIEGKENVIYIYGSMPVFTYPGLNVSIIFDDKIKIYHQKGLTVFKPF